MLILWHSDTACSNLKWVTLLSCSVSTLEPSFSLTPAWLPRTKSSIQAEAYNPACSWSCLLLSFCHKQCKFRLNCRKFPKISPGAYVFQRPFWRGLHRGGNLRFKISWASPVAGSKITVFPLFYLVFEGNFPSASPRGPYVWRGYLTEGFFRYRFGGLIHRGAYFWNFTVLWVEVLILKKLRW